VRTHLQKLVDLEYVLTHRGGRGQSFVYELVYGGEGADGKPFTLGLIDTQTLQNHTYGKKFEHENGQFEGSSSIQSAPIAAGSCMPENAEPPGNHRPERASCEQPVKITAQAATSGASYRSHTPYLSSSLAASPNGNGQRVRHGA
jgi:DNA primase